MTRSLLAATLLLLSGCATNTEHQSHGGGKDWTPPPAGTVVAADSMKVVEDQLNNAYFSVRLTVAEGNSGNTKDGFKYDVHAAYGKATADGVIVMPYRGERLKPLIRRSEGYNYVIGFIPGELAGSNDTSFHEYYLIVGDPEYIRINPMKGFIIE